MVTRPTPNGGVEMIRLSGYTIYTVALGNVAASDVYDTPDASDLEDVFAQLVDRILTRLTR
jgi:hypothetical protein